MFATALILLGASAGSAVSVPVLQDSSAVYVRLDNDAFADRDWGYTSGVKLGFISPTVDSFEDARLTPRLRAFSRRLAWLQPRGFDEYNVSISIGQDMFTPEDWRLSEIDPLDRPYAGVLAAGITYNGRNAQTMRSTTLNVGIVGPSSAAERLQNLLHELNGSREFRGWEHQLNDELVFRVLHQRARKWDLVDAARMSDAIVHYGGSFGNLTTFANAGVELRFGRALPDNFGSAPALPGLENTAPTRMAQFAQRSSMHGYVALDARYVLRDITLDGNTWRDSASIAREDLVVDFGVGFALYWQGWKITFARYFRTNEFEGQSSSSRLGSLTIRRALAE